MEASWPVPKVIEPSPVKAPSTSKTTRPSEKRSMSLKSQLLPPEARKAKLASKVGLSTNSSKSRESEAGVPEASAAQFQSSAAFFFRISPTAQVNPSGINSPEKERSSDTVKSPVKEEEALTVWVKAPEMLAVPPTSKEAVVSPPALMPRRDPAPVSSKLPEPEELVKLNWLMVPKLVREEP